MDYFLTDDQIMIRDLTRTLAEEKIRPVRAQLDENEEFPTEIIKEIGRADLFSVFIPKEYGGFGGGCLDLVIVVEELSRVCAGVALSYAASILGLYPLMLFGSDEQKQKYLPRIVEGKTLAAFALTEPDAGSDAGGIKTTAKLCNDEYVLNGTKQWITNGGEADIYTVIAMTDKKRGSRGASAFVVEKGTPGFDFGKKEKKMGIRASATRELIFNNCIIPKSNIIKKEGMGFLVAMKTLDRSRPGIGAQALGIAQGAMEEALSYAKDRVQFNQPISSFQAIQHMLADMGTQIEAARSLIYSVSRYIDGGAQDISKVAAMSKVFASDTAMKVTTDAVQIMGGYGYMKDYPLEKMMRDAKITQIYEGTNQIQRNVIALNMIKENARKR